MTNSSSDLHVTYLGWSGFRLSWSGGPQVVVDPPDVAGLDLERETWLLLSHGHSEHVAGALKYLADTTRVTPVTVVASQTVCRYLQCRHSHTDDRFIPCRPGDVKILPNLRIDVFSWRHMPLLPSGLRPTLRHLFHLVSHLDFTMKIIRGDLKVMRIGPMLGFRIVPKRGPRLLLYSEGLHLHTSKIEAKEIGQLLDADVLLFAVRPEDAHVIPELVATIGSSVAVPYEAHRFWRKGFGLPIADLDNIVIQLKNRGISAMTVTKGETIILSNTHPPLVKSNSA